jgi:hypothetical protein
VAESIRSRRLVAPLVLLIGFAVLAGVLSGRAAAAGVGARIKTFTTELSSTQAGGHPDLFIDFTLGSRVDPVVPEENGANSAKDVTVETPGGFFGNVHAISYCTSTQFQIDECPADSQVGTAYPHVLVNEGTGIILNLEPVYNMEPEPGQAGLLAFKGSNFNFPNYIVISSRTNGDFGLNAVSRGITNYFALWGFELELWGVPASPIHDAKRFTHGGGFPSGNPSSSNLPERPFLTMPTSCTGPLKAWIETVAYDGVHHRGYTDWPATTGCDQLPFNPSLSAKPSTAAADSASGLDVALKVPQTESPDTPTGSDIRANKVTLPPGFSINPSAADGKVACSDAQANVGSTEEAQCPPYSKVGTALLDSWTLPAPIEGSIYLGEPRPGDPYRLILTADGYATHIKLLGTTRADPRTGQLVTEFPDLPQAPYTEFDLHFFGSERGLFATPTQCSTYTVESEFVPWASELANQTSTQFFNVTSGPGGSPCPPATRSFRPGFRAAAVTNGAGTHSPFSLNVERADGEQNLSTIGIKTPPGFTATLKGIPNCSESVLAELENPDSSGAAELLSPRCPAASQIGTVVAGAGAGSRPVYVNGRVFLAGPYKGAPLSFVVITPAVSGPYDLGNVVNRVPIKIDPVTAAVTAVSDPLPQIIDGIPLRLRSVLINLNRPGFTLNPTNCRPYTLSGVLAGDQGSSSEPTGRFQVANCDSLGFEPKLTTVLKGGTKRGAHPALTAILTQDPSGESNISRAVVALPHSEFLDQAHIGTICTRVQFAADKCPAASIYGHAKAVTPLLDQPLEGPVYLRSSSHTLPDLVAALKGPALQPIEIDLDGRIDSKNGGIRTTFESIPDQPVSKFVLSMRGGKKGLLQNSANLCRGTHITKVKLVGQNGSVIKPNTPLKARCGKAGRRNATKKGGKR